MKGYEFRGHRQTLPNPYTPERVALTTAWTRAVLAGNSELAYKIEQKIMEIEDKEYGWDRAKSQMYSVTFAALQSRNEGR